MVVITKHGDLKRIQVPGISEPEYMMCRTDFQRTCNFKCPLVQQGEDEWNGEKVVPMVQILCGCQPVWFEVAYDEREGKC